MYYCDTCGKALKNLSGLSGHKRLKHNSTTTSASERLQRSEATQELQRSESPESISPIALSGPTPPERQPLVSDKQRVEVLERSLKELSLELAEYDGGLIDIDEDLSARAYQLAAEKGLTVKGALGYMIDNYGPESVINHIKLWDSLVKQETAHPDKPTFADHVHGQANDEPAEPIHYRCADTTCELCRPFNAEAFQRGLDSAKEHYEKALKNAYYDVAKGTTEHLVNIPGVLDAIQRDKASREAQEKRWPRSPEGEEQIRRLLGGT